MKKSKKQGNKKHGPKTQYKGNPADYRWLDLSDEKLQWLMDKVTEDIMVNRLRVRFPETDEEVEELLRKIEASEEQAENISSGDSSESTTLNTDRDAARDL